ncbi:MAG: hypothetical protein QXS12_04095, partial [Candidatus Caldarchaeum sp.]
MGGKRKTQGLFLCPYCGEYTADLNGAVNIAKKFKGRAYSSSTALPVNQPTPEVTPARMGQFTSSSGF